MLIYKILRTPEWQDLRTAGHTNGAPIDLTDGFVHLSTGDQVAGTLAKHFANQDGLVLLAMDSDVMGPELKWEPSRDDALFPHLYRPLRQNEVLWSADLPLVDGNHVLPDRMRT